MAEMILVVDDDKDVRFVAQRGLLARGYAVLETGDPQQAIRMAKGQTRGNVSGCVNEEKAV